MDGQLLALLELVGVIDVEPGEAYDPGHIPILPQSGELWPMLLLRSKRMLFPGEPRLRAGRRERARMRTPRRRQSAGFASPSSTRPGGSVALLVTASVPAFALACSLATEVEQPIAFVHKIHVAEEEIPCTECHTGAEEAEHATIPAGEICLDCHEDAIGESAEEVKLVEMLASGEPISPREMAGMASMISPW